jgi:hypothetical protein
MRAIFIVLILMETLAFGQRLQLNNLGQPFALRHGRIEWSMTNSLPITMNVYRVSPTKFSAGLISNVVALGGFTNHAQVISSLSPALKGRDCLFEEEPARKAISILPRRGTISFINSRTKALARGGVTNVPGNDETLRLARQVYHRLGMDEAAFAKNDTGKEPLFWRTRETHQYKRDGKPIKEQTANGLYLVRGIDGVSFAGVGTFGGLYLLFGNEGKIANFDLCWRNLSTSKELRVVDRNRIADWIRKGKEVFLEPEPDLPPVIEKLVITDVIPHYYGFNSSEVQEWVYPFLTLEGFAEGAGRKTRVVLCCPASEDD